MGQQNLWGQEPVGSGLDITAEWFANGTRIRPLAGLDMSASGFLADVIISIH